MGSRVWRWPSTLCIGTANVLCFFVCLFWGFFSFFFFFGCTLSISTFLGQSSKPSFSCNLHHSCSNAGSLTRFTRAETPNIPLKWRMPTVPMWCFTCCVVRKVICTDWIVLIKHQSAAKMTLVKGQCKSAGKEPSVHPNCVLKLKLIPSKRNPLWFLKSIMGIQIYKLSKSLFIGYAARQS